MCQADAEGTYCSLPVLQSESTCVQTEQIGDNSHSRVSHDTSHMY